jgi:hypothetical protein
MPAIGWTFPSNNDGREDGLNDPGIETFRDNPLRSLSREITQNSCDATDDSAKAVEIHFELIDLPMNKFPEADQFRRILKACEKYWESNQAAKKFFRNALKVMSGKTIRVLRVSDYNTTGLIGPSDDRNSDWFKLTKAVGASDKAGGAGGSFGIGKHAPFACSDLRTILYGTKDTQSRIAFQGVSKLVTHNNAKGTTQGTGYFGFKNKNAPIDDSSLIDKIFRRTKVGTDLFILGFLRNKEWADEVAKGLLGSFFVSIHEGRLLARVGDVAINRNTLTKLFDKYSREDPDWAASAYYQTLISEEASSFSEEDFQDLGRIELRILPSKDYPKRVAMVRSTGMKIYDKGHFQTPIRFAGVFVAKGENLNEFLRSTEPPSHDQWEPNRHEDPSYARNVLNQLNGWIRDKVRSLSEIHGFDELDADGISQYLPDDLDETSQITENVSEGERLEPEPDISVQVRAHDKLAALSTGAPNLSGEGEDDVGLEGEGPFGGDGKGGGGGDGGGSGGTGDGSKTKKGGSERGPTPSSRQVGLRSVRVYCTDSEIGKYRIMCEPNETQKGFLRIHVVGEVGQEPAPIQEVWLEGASVSAAPGPNGVIGPLELEEGQRVSLDVVLEDALHCALGVSAYAD